MLRLSLALSLVVSAAFAETTPEDLRTKILAGDTRGVAAAFADSRNASVKTQRILFDVTSSSDPEVVRFVRRWVSEQPGSVYAHAALARSLLEAGYDMRGDRTVGNTWTNAFRRSRKLELKAAEHAWLAYAIDPGLAPLVDTLILLDKTVPGPKSADELLAEIMETVPNTYVLEDALIAYSPQWGGSLDEMWRLCETYAPKVTDPPGFTVEVCMARSIIYSGHQEAAAEWLGEVVVGSTTPLLAKERAVVAIQGFMRGDQSGQAAIEAYLNDPTVTDLATAGGFDSVYANVRQLPPIEPIIYARAAAKAKAEIAFDPFDPKKLLILGGASEHNGAPEDRPPVEETRAWLFKALATAPYDPKTWRMLASAYQQRDFEPDNVEPLSEIYLENAVVYSNHDVQYLNRLFDAQTFRLQTLAKSRGVKWGAPLTAEWLDPTTEAAACRVIRTSIVREHVCKGGDWSCQFVYQSDVADKAKASAKELGICTRELTAWSASSLYYSERPVEIEPSPFDE